MPLTRYTCKMDGYTVEDVSSLAIWEHINSIHHSEGVTKQWWKENIKEEQVFTTGT